MKLGPILLVATLCSNMLTFFSTEILRKSAAKALIFYVEILTYQQDTELSTCDFVHVC